MNYRELMREYIKSPIDGTSAREFGKWAILNQEQRKMIGRLLDEMDRFDEAYKALWMKIDKINSFCEDYLKLSNKQKEEYMLDPVLVIKELCK